LHLENLATGAKLVLLHLGTPHDDVRYYFNSGQKRMRSSAIHSITSSARVSNEGGTAMPSALAK
jgi:hypothetical protein